MSDAATVVTALTPYLAEGDLTCILADHGAGRPLTVDLRVRFGATAFAGPARTIFSPSGSLVPILSALADLPAGAVPVVQAEAFPGAVWGGRLSARATARDAAGVIVLGRVRDVATLAQGALGVAALGIAPHRSEARDAGATDVPLTIGSWIVHPGDVIVADDNGAVAVPAASFGEVAGHIDAWVAHERAADQEASS